MLIFLGKHANRFIYYYSQCSRTNKFNSYLVEEGEKRKWKLTKKILIELGEYLFSWVFWRRERLWEKSKSLKNVTLYFKKTH